MDFFKSVFSDDTEHSDPEISPPSSPELQSQEPKPSSPSTNPNPSSTPKIQPISNAWTFGSSLIKTLASKSESVIETYRRDLEDFGSGLRKETAVIREAASRAVKDLPASLEAGAAAAQESLESVGQAVDNLGNTVVDIIAHGKESILVGDSDSETSDSDTKHISSSQHNLNSNSKPYSRLDAQIRAIQCGMNTYCEEPEDLDEYNEWKLGFVLAERADEIEDLIEDNGVIEEIYNGIVPSTVDHETFWTRYFYKVYKVKKVEEARAKLVKRAISGEEEEELSWDVDDDYEEIDGSKLKGDSEGRADEKDYLEKNVEKSEVETKEGLKRENDDKGRVSESPRDLEEVDKKGNSESSGKMTSDGKADNGRSCKDSDFSVISSQPSPEEEDLGWDEIEDIGSSDDNKTAARGSPIRADLHRRLSAAEEEEDLTWDIEDDDEPVGS